MKKIEYVNALDFDLDEVEVEQKNDLPSTTILPAVPAFKVATKPKVHKAVVPLGVSDNPSVTLHKGGGKIVITPNDVHAAVALIEIRERIAQLANPVLTATREKLEVQLLPDIQPGDFSRATRAWSLVNVKLDEHPMVRLLARYHLGVTISPSLGNWVKKEEKRLAKELTPFLLPDFKDERSLFEKVEAGMVLECIKNFDFDNQRIFTKGNRYQIVDTARGGQAGSNAEDAKEHQDGMVKISKVAIAPGCKIIMADDTVFPWTVFNGDLENNFHYEEKVIYEPSKCVPARYPELLAMYQKRLDAMGLELYDHVKVDAVQEALKRGTLNGKLMRMGKTSESIVCAMFWGSKRVAIVAPRNARLFTVKEFERLGLKNYVVVDSMEDLKKPGTFYLLTYSWMKKTFDPHRVFRRKGQSYLHRTYTENRKEITVEHKCPFCKRSLERLDVKKNKSAEGFLLEKTISWTKERGYICRNQLCDCKVKFTSRTGAPINGAAWGYTIDSTTRKIKRAKPIKLGGQVQNIKSFTGAKVDQVVQKKGKVKNDEGKMVDGIIEETVTFPDSYIGWIDWGLKFHQDCKDKNVKGRYCHECHQADAVWIPAPYKQRILTDRSKKVHLKDYFTGAIIDEIHTIKSLDSDTGKAIRSIRAKRRMGLTGTLMPNTPADAFWPLHWVFKGGSAAFPYHQKDGATEFYDRFCEYINIKRGHGLKDSRKMLPYLKNPVAFWELMSSKMVRRNYEDELVKASLAKANRYYPNVEFHRVESTMDPKQAQLMVAAINHFESNFNQYAAQVAQQGHLLNQAMVVSQMVYLRIGATCPEYFNAKLKKVGKPAIYDGPLGGGKMSDIQNICATKVASNEKVVVLTDFVEMRKSLAKMLSEHNPIVFDGTWDDDERNENFEAFLEDPTRKIFIAGTRQIREGTNLSAANTVICCDLLWEPGLQQQAWSRAFTPTSENRTCNVYVLMAKNSIDEHVYNTFYAKVAAAEQALDRKVINRRAHQVDLRWFVDRVLSDREGLLSYLKEEGEKGIFVNEKTFQMIEDRDV